MPVGDVDFAVPLGPEQVIARVQAAGLNVIPTGLPHGTVTVLAEGRGFEVTSLRRDVLSDGRHAVVALTDDWAVDASRRDFTINAMSANRDGEVFDYFGGRQDLAAGRVRFVGMAQARIAEDFLRIFRFFRFFARYGRGAPDPEAIAAIQSLGEGVRGLSAERVWSELKRILAADDPRRAVALMAETGVLGMVVLEPDVAALEALVARGAPRDVLLRVAALVLDDVDGFADRWRLSGEEQAGLAALRGVLPVMPDSDDDVLRRALAETPAAVLIDRSWLAQDGRPGWDMLRKRLREMARPVFPLQGRHLVALGVAPGPELGRILEAVRAWWLAGGCVADFQACLVKAKADALF